MEVPGIESTNLQALRPPMACNRVRHLGIDFIYSDIYCQSGEKDKMSRRIFHCVPYTEFEKQKINELQAQLVAKKIETDELYY